MNDFWNNIVRYPRFFISSLAGLILILLNPLKNLFKIKQLRPFVILFIFSMGFIVFLIVKAMIGL